VADQAEAVESLRGGRLEFVANERVKFAFVALRVTAAITADLI
jgi:hypothetical protein